MDYLGLKPAATTSGGTLCFRYQSVNASRKLTIVLMHVRCHGQGSRKYQKSVDLAYDEGCSIVCFLLGDRK